MEIFRRQSVERQDPAHGIPAIQSSLWATQQGRVRDIEHFGIIGILVHHRDIIHIHAYDRVVDT